MSAPYAEAVHLIRDANGDAVLDGCAFVRRYSDGKPGWGFLSKRARDTAHSVLRAFISRRAARMLEKAFYYFVVSKCSWAGRSFTRAGVWAWARAMARGTLGPDGRLGLELNAGAMLVALTALNGGVLPTVDQSAERAVNAAGIAALFAIPVAWASLVLSGVAGFGASAAWISGALALGLCGYVALEGSWARRVMCGVSDCLAAKGHVDLSAREAAALARSARRICGKVWSPSAALAVARRIPEEEEMRLLPIHDDVMRFHALRRAMKMAAVSAARHARALKPAPRRRFANGEVAGR